MLDYKILASLVLVKIINAFTSLEAFIEILLFLYVVNNMFDLSITHCSLKSSCFLMDKCS